MSILFKIVVSFLVLFSWSINAAPVKTACEAFLEVDGTIDQEVYVRGTFNKWLLDTPMQFINGRWQKRLFLAPGDYPYEFYSKKDARAIKQRERVPHMFFNNLRFPRLRVVDCQKPILSLKAPVEKTGGGYQFVVSYRAGISGGDIDLSKSKVYLNGEEINLEFRLRSKEFVVSAQNLPEGKYSYLFKVVDQYGNVGKNLYLPIWIENKKFFWQDAIMYQILTDRFVDGDSSNNNPVVNVPYKSNWQGGDFKGIIEKISDGYFESLGVNTLYISSPITNTSSSGLGISDSYQYSAYHSYWPIALGYSDENDLGGIIPIEPRFGTSEDLKALVNAAHQKGIRVIADFVANHVHEESILWKKRKDFFTEVFICGWDKPLICWFTEYLPDLNFKNTEVMNLVINHALWMIQTFDFDGVRLDALKHMEMDLVENLRFEIKQNIETTGIPFYLIGETFSGIHDEIGEYLGKEKIDGQFDFPLFFNLSNLFLLDKMNFREFYKFLNFNDTVWQKYYPDALMSNFIGNHDIPRAISIANNDFYPDSSQLGGEVAKYRAWNNPPQNPDRALPYQKLKMAFTFIFTMPGIPLIYQGDEIGMAGAQDPDNRRMMYFSDWSNNQKMIFEHLQKLSNARLKHLSLRHGTRNERWINEKFFVYSMSYKNSVSFVVFNKNNYTFSTSVNVSADGLITGKLCDMLSEKCFDIADSQVKLTVPEMSSMVLEYRE